MNNHTKLVVSVLFVVILLLAIGITRFYFDVSKDTGSTNSFAEIVRRLDVDSNGNRIFEDGVGLYGIVDKNDKVIVAPEWVELSFTNSNRCCIASKRIGNRLLSGCIDYEGNINIPFIYKNISKYKNEDFVFYVAESDSDDSCVIYDENFQSCFMSSWKDFSVEDDQLTLSDETGVFTYNFGENGFLCKEATISCQALGKDYDINIFSRLLLSKLNFKSLETIARSTEKYLEYAFTGDSTLLTPITTVSHSNFLQIFPDDHKILSKSLLGISDIFVYSEKNENDIPTYVVSLIANTEISYADEKGETQKLQGEYKAVIKFNEYSSSITAISGGFIKPEPDYPSNDDNPPETSEDFSQYSQNNEELPQM